MNHERVPSRTKEAMKHITILISILAIAACGGKKPEPKEPAEPKEAEAEPPPAAEITTSTRATTESEAPQATSRGRASALTSATITQVPVTALSTTPLQPLYDNSEASAYSSTTSKSTTPNALAIRAAKRIRRSPGRGDQPRLSACEAGDPIAEE